jgi:hypothetical protein
MGISQIITGIAVFVTGLVPMSCHTTAATKKSSPSATVAGANSGTAGGGATNAPTLQHDLGQISLTNQIETCVNLGSGQDCVLKPKQLDSRTYELTLSVESKTQAGKLQDLSVAQVTTKNGAPLEVAVGDFEISLTPNMVRE